jgi:hypothetical protein
MGPADRELRKEIEGFGNAGLATMVPPMANPLGIHPSSIRKYYEAVKYEA